MKSSTKNKRQLDHIPVDRTRALANRLVFGKSLSGVPSTEDEDFIRYQVNQGDDSIQYQFDKGKLTSLLNQLKKQFDGKVSLGDIGRSMFYSMLLFSAQDGTGLEGECTLSQIRHQLGLEKGGKQNDQIKKAAYSLASLFIVKTKVKNVENQDIDVYPYFSYFKIRVRQDETVFSYRFNEMALGANASWLQSKDLSRKGFTHGYLTVPVSELKVIRSDRKYDAFRERLRNLKGDVFIDVFLSTILQEWLFLSNDRLRRKTYCLDLVNGFFIRAKQEGLIRECKVRVNAELKSWRDQYKYVIMK